MLLALPPICRSVQKQLLKVFIYVHLEDFASRVNFGLSALSFFHLTLNSDLRRQRNNSIPSQNGDGPQQAATRAS